MITPTIGRRYFTHDRSDQPKRIRRLWGQKLPKVAMFVDAPSRFANPHTIAALRAAGHNFTEGRMQELSVRKFSDDLRLGRLPFTEDDVRRFLGGRDLACYCDPGIRRCHVHVLLKVANPETKRPAG